MTDINIINRSISESKILNESSTPNTTKDTAKEKIKGKC